MVVGSYIDLSCRKEVSNAVNACLTEIPLLYGGGKSGRWQVAADGGKRLILPEQVF